MKMDMLFSFGKGEEIIAELQRKMDEAGGIGIQIVIYLKFLLSLQSIYI